MAIQGNVNINLEDILTKVTAEELFIFYTGGLPAETLCSSPLRKDNQPSFIYGDRGAQWRYKDFGTQDNGNIIDFVRAKYKCNYIEAINIIVNDFNIIDRKILYFPEIIGRDPNSSRKKKSIKIKTSNWNSFYLEYWYEYGISHDTLLHFDVYPITHYWVLNKKTDTYRVVKTYMAYAYKLENHTKILDVSPYTFQKWVSDCSTEHWQGAVQMPKRGDTLIITKSLKDVMVLYECGIISVAPQSEVHIFPDNIFSYIKRNYKNIIILFDNDEPGVNATNKLIKNYNLPCIYTPKGTKDISEYSKKFGIIKTKKFMLKQINKLIS